MEFNTHVYWYWSYLLDQARDMDKLYGTDCEKDVRSYMFNSMFNEFLYHIDRPCT